MELSNVSGPEPPDSVFLVELFLGLGFVVVIAEGNVAATDVYLAAGKWLVGDLKNYKPLRPL
jgi:hypothetical protein